MKVTAIKTHKILPNKESIFEVLDRHLPSLQEGSVIAVTSKILSLCEGRVIAKDQVNKQELIEQEADLFIPPDQNRYNLTLTVKNHMLAPTSGIDESNVQDIYVLWPEDAQKSVNQIWEYLRKKHNLKNLGVILTDSGSFPLKWGVIGRCMAFCGFVGLDSKVGKPDIFGRPFKFTRVNVAEALAVATVLLMGETNEQQPLAVVEDLDFVKFKDKVPSEKGLKSLTVDLADDLYAALLTSADWHKGGGGKK